MKVRFRVQPSTCCMIENLETAVVSAILPLGTRAQKGSTFFSFCDIAFM